VPDFSSYPDIRATYRHLNRNLIVMGHSVVEDLASVIVTGTNGRTGIRASGGRPLKELAQLLRNENRGCWRKVNDNLNSLIFIATTNNI
jgi:hypothetical protein